MYVLPLIVSSQIQTSRGVSRDAFGRDCTVLMVHCSVLEVSYVSDMLDTGRIFYNVSSHHPQEALLPWTNASPINSDFSERIDVLIWSVVDSDEIPEILDLYKHLLRDSSSKVIIQAQHCTWGRLSSYDFYDRCKKEISKSGLHPLEQANDRYSATILAANRWCAVLTRFGSQPSFKKMWWCLPVRPGGNEGGVWWLIGPSLKIEMYPKKSKTLGCEHGRNLPNIIVSKQKLGSWCRWFVWLVAGNQHRESIWQVISRGFGQCWYISGRCCMGLGTEHGRKRPSSKKLTVRVLLEHCSLLF